MLSLSLETNLEFRIEQVTNLRAKVTKIISLISTTTKGNRMLSPEKEVWEVISRCMEWTDKTLNTSLLTSNHNKRTKANLLRANQNKRVMLRKPSRRLKVIFLAVTFMLNLTTLMAEFIQEYLILSDQANQNIFLIWVTTKEAKGVIESLLGMEPRSWMILIGKLYRVKRKQTQWWETFTPRVTLPLQCK